MYCSHLLCDLQWQLELRTAAFWLCVRVESSIFLLAYALQEAKAEPEVFSSCRSRATAFCKSQASSQRPVKCEEIRREVENEARKRGDA